MTLIRTQFFVQNNIDIYTTRHHATTLFLVKYVNTDQPNVRIIDIAVDSLCDSHIALNGGCTIHVNVQSLESFLGCATFNKIESQKIAPFANKETWQIRDQSRQQSSLDDHSSF